MKLLSQAALLVLLLAMTWQAQGQTFYYSQKKKIYLEEDTSTIVVKTVQPAAQADAVRILSRAGLPQSAVSKKGEYLLLKKGKLNKTAILQQLRASKDVIYAWHLLKAGETILVATGSILVRPVKGTGPEAMLAVVGASGKATIQGTNKYGDIQLKVMNDRDVFAIANALYESGRVEWAHPDFLAPLKRTTNDPLFNNQWHLRNTGQFGGTPGVDINVEAAWNITDGQPTVRVAVIDDGVEDHEDFRDGSLVPGFTPRIPGATGWPLPGARHGQACAGIIAGEHNNQIGGAGVAPGATIVPVNILAGGETLNDVATAINWAWDQGQADVLSNSWTMDPPFDAVAVAITQARTNGRGGLGSIVVFCSGNDYSGVDFPATLDGVIAVGAITQTGALHGYSNTGPSMDLVAPSGSVPAVAFGLDDPINGIRTMDREGTNGYINGNYVSFNGTSASCPQVAGVAALMLSVNPALTETAARSILQTTATDMGAAGFDNSFGFGRVNACNAVLGALNVSFTGNTSFCTGSAAYAVNNLPAHIPVTWTAIPAGVVTMVTNGHQATLTQIANGTVTLTAHFACRTYTRTIVVGRPLIYSGFYTWTGYPHGTPMGLVEDGYGLNTVCFARPTTAATTMMDIRGANNVTWNGLVQGGVTWTQGGNNVTINFKAANRIAEMVVSATNTCGSSNKYYTFQSISCPQSAAAGDPALLTEADITISPNPARQFVNIGLAAKVQQETGISTIRIYDVMGRLRKQYRINNLNNTTLDVQDLTTGLYFVEVVTGHHKVRKNLYVNR